jgi:hypothetical protein
MPEAKDEEVGRRLFQIHKEKAVEVALEKIRRKMPSEWKSFTSADIDILKDLEEIILAAKQVKNKEKLENVAIDEVCTMIISKE